MEKILKNLEERKKHFEDKARNKTGEGRAELKGKAEGIGIAISMIKGAIDKGDLK